MRVRVAVGEIATYQVTLTLPEGVLPNASVVDTLPAGMALVGCDSVTASSTDVTTNLAGGFAGACTGSNPAGGRVCWPTTFQRDMSTGQPAAPADQLRSR